MGTVTDFESSARTIKAHRLAMAAIRHAGTGAVPELAAAATRMPYEWWLSLADLEGVRRPSTATVAAAVAILSAEANRPPLRVVDPFEGSW